MTCQHPGRLQSQFKGLTSGGSVRGKFTIAQHLHGPGCSAKVWLDEEMSKAVLIMHALFPSAAAAEVMLLSS